MLILGMMKDAGVECDTQGAFACSWCYGTSNRLHPPLTSNLVHPACWTGLNAALNACSKSTAWEAALGVRPPGR